MAPTLEFGLLGPLMVRCDGVPVTIQRGKQRVLLAFLLMKILAKKAKIPMKLAAIHGMLFSNADFSGCLSWRATIKS